MIRLLQFILVISLFIIVRILVSREIGKRARKCIFNGIGYKTSFLSDIKNNEFIRNVIVFIGVFIVAVINGYKILSAIFLGAITIVFVYGIKKVKQKFCKKQVLQDLLNISECLRVQISSQIPLGTALKSLSELCVNLEFKGLVTNMYLEYELSKFIIMDSAEAMLKKFNYPEIRIFISSLNQQIQGTSAIEALDNLISVLKEEYIEFLEENTKNKIAIMVIGVFFIVLNIAALGVYPIAVEAFNAMNVMFK